MTWLGQAAVSGQILHSTNDESFVGFTLLNGDVSGLLESVTVGKILGRAVENVIPSPNDIMQWDGNKWAIVASTSGPHELLSATHTDTNDASVARGALVVGTGAVAAWGTLTLGTQEFVLYSDGTDAVYTRLGSVTPFSLGTDAAPSITFTGDTDTGLSAETANVLVASAGGYGHLIVDGANDRITLDAGQIVRCVDRVTYTVTAADYYIGVTAAPATVTMPPTPASGELHVIKDRNGNAAVSSRITIDGNGNNVDGNSSIEIRNAYGSFTLLYNGTQWNVI